MTDADRDEMLVSIFNLLSALAERMTGDGVNVCFTKNRWATDKTPQRLWIIPSRAAVNWIPQAEAEGLSDGALVQAPTQCDKPHRLSASQKGPDVVAGPTAIPPRQ